MLAFPILLRDHTFDPERVLNLGPSYFTPVWNHSRRRLEIHCKQFHSWMMRMPSHNVVI